MPGNNKATQEELHWGAERGHPSPLQTYDGFRRIQVRQYGKHNTGNMGRLVPRYRRQSCHSVAGGRIPRRLAQPPRLNVHSTPVD
jgi:hypothetical protein